MSAARAISLIFCLLILAAIVIIIGCQPDRTGTATPNSEPKVFPTNVPPDSANFSRNPDLNWYATDIDGYIRFFRYAVVVESLMVINNVRVTPDVFVEEATDRQFGWDTLRVDLDHPQSTARIRLYANVDFPVDSFVTQYFFIQAQDDQGAMSEIKWRMYSRNNHYPNTDFDNDLVYINAKNANSPAPGIQVDWVGADSADYGRALPPLEFEWRLYGPFLDTATVFVYLVKEDCVPVPGIPDSFVNCIDVKVLDLENLPPAVGGKAQPLMHSKGPNYANDPNDVWVTETQTTLYNVFEGMDLPSTSQYKFIFWVRARDDGFVPDPSPSFGQFLVVEALFEKQAAVLDETGYTNAQGRWAPISLDTVKAVFYDYIRGAGYTEFDSLSGEHFFFTADQKDALETPVVPAWPTLVDILSHRVLIYVNDDAEGGPNENADFGILDDVFFGLDMGASAWVFARNLGNTSRTTRPGAHVGKSILFMYHFGIQEVVVEGWLYHVFLDLRNPIFNEQFIGAYPNFAGYPAMMVDYGEGSLLDSTHRYPRMFTKKSHVMEGLPEIGVGQRTMFAAPLYLYLSKDGDKSYYHGKVCGVAQQIGDMRSACFLFTPLAMKPVAMQEVFQTMLTWLSAKFQAAPGVSLKVAEPYESPYADVTARRQRVQEYLHFLSENADRKEVARYGIILKPYEITPGGGK